MLVVVRTVTTLSRLLDIVSLLERDPRVQVVFTHAQDRPARLAAGVAEALAALGAPVLPWREAARTRFDLALAASENDELHELRAPIVLVPHGIGYQKFYPGSTVTSGMDPGRLVRGGRVVPDVLALSHAAQQERLRESCPAAAGRARVLGDPCLDRMLASRHHVPRYRRALRAEGRALVVLASTWGPDSLVGRHLDLPLRLLGCLPADEYRIGVVLHPGIWSAHGPWQVRAWLADAVESGIALIPPQNGWQATILAADCVVSDDGSAALYAACVGRPVLFATPGTATTVPDSALRALRGLVPTLDHGADLRAQVEAARRAHRAGAVAAAVRQAVDRPGKSAQLLRSLLYEYLRLPEPDWPAEYRAVEAPTAPPADAAAYVVRADHEGGALALKRFPARSELATQQGKYEHIVAHAEAAELREVDGAAVVHTDRAEDFDRWSAETLRHWPVARIAAATTVSGDCLVRTRGGERYRLRAEGVDPLLLASLAYVRLAADEAVPGTHSLRVGSRSVTVSAR